MAVLALIGCVSGGASYRAPPIAVPAEWSVAGSESPRDAEALAEWWRAFDDPVLDSLVRASLRANLDLASARAQLREARALRRLAGAELGPRLDAAASARRSRSSEATGGGDTRNLFRAGFDASWEPDIFGGLRRGVQAAEADVQASVESSFETQVSLVAEVALNYLDLRTAELRLAIAEANIEALAEIHDLARWRAEAGLVSELDVVRASAELERTRATTPALRTQLAEAYNRLSVLLGRAPGRLAAQLPPTGVVPVAAPSIAIGIPADTLRQRPDVRAAERRLAAQTARLGQAEAARYPSLDLSGSIGLEALTLGGLASTGALAWSLLGGITAPIFHSGRIEANVDLQDARVEQARIAYHAAVLLALEDVENALVALANASTRKTRLTRAVDSARDAHELAQHRYSSGLADFLTVLDSQRTLLGLEDELASTTGDVARAQIQLYKALGGGWAQQPVVLEEEDL